jgi:hydrogenase maturation protease
MNDRKTESPPVAIVGTGNWLVAHDRIGPRVLEMIAGRYGPEVELFNTGTAGLALLDCIKGQELMLVVDACISGNPPGTIKVTPFRSEPKVFPGSGIHQIGPSEALSVARHLYSDKLPKHILFILVETAGINDLELENACREVVSVIDQNIDRWRSNRQKENTRP